MSTDTRDDGDGWLAAPTGPGFYYQDFPNLSDGPPHVEIASVVVWPGGGLFVAGLYVSLTHVSEYACRWLPIPGPAELIDLRRRAERAEADLEAVREAVVVFVHDPYGPIESSWMYANQSKRFDASAAAWADFLANCHAAQDASKGEQP